jgi:hypothetical protein
MGILGAQGAFGPEYTGLQAQGYGSFAAGGSGNPNANAMMALAQQSSGRVKYAPASDLVNGLADCSGSISDLVEMLQTGTTSPARLFDTTAFASDESAAKLGFLPGNMPGALNVGVNPYPGMSGHMAATLPNGVNFEGGGGTGGGAQYGGNASGALDPQFEKRYYMPLPVGPAPGFPGTPTPGVPPGPSWAPPPVVPTSGPGGGGPMAPGMPQGFPTAPPPTQPALGASAGAPVGKAAGAGGWQPQGGGGAGVTGGLLGAAATTAAGMFPGGGVAAETAMKLITRSIGYGGQLASVGVSGLLETFGLNDTQLGDPSKSWVGRAAAGIAGAAPALPTSAGQTKPPADPKQAEGQPQGGQQGHGPLVNIENWNQSPDRRTEQSVKDLQSKSRESWLR